MPKMPLLGLGVLLWYGRLSGLNSFFDFVDYSNL